VKTLLLDTKTWDLVLDTAGNIAVASDPYSIQQDVCSAVRTFLGEVWYDQADGVDYDHILGRSPTLQFLQSQIEAAALTVPDVVSATVVITGLSGRDVTGQVQFSYSVTDTATGAVTVQTATITFIGDNTKAITFLGTNGLQLDFVGAV
jgi:hypothetical protein